MVGIENLDMMVYITKIGPTTPVKGLWFIVYGLGFQIEVAKHLWKCFQPRKINIIIILCLPGINCSKTLAKPQTINHKL
jgi:hypothetical protein